jgi:hypothetical protein
MTIPSGTDHPTDAVLLELGRLVWAAINLEDVVYPLCRSVRPRHGPFDDIPAGTRIKEALEDLQERSPDGLRDRAGAWLREAKDALEERNAILHGTPEIFMRVDGSEGPEEQPPPRLTQFPRNRSRPPVHTDLTVEALGRFRRRLEEAREGWSDLTSDLWASRPASS